MVVWMELQDDLVTARRVSKRFATWEDAEEYAATVDPASAAHARILPNDADEAVRRARGYHYQSGLWAGRNKWGAIVLKNGAWIPYRDNN